MSLGRANSTRMSQAMGVALLALVGACSRDPKAAPSGDAGAAEGALAPAEEPAQVDPAEGAPAPAEEPVLVDPAEADPAEADPANEESGDFGSRVRCVSEASEWTCELTRGLIAELTDESSALSSELVRQARIVPFLESDEVHGFKFSGIRRGSFPALLGMQNGDVLVSLGGDELGSVEQALTAFSGLAEGGEFELKFERDGEPLTMTMKIVDALSGPPAGL
ncbi:hypothetical protein G6O69_23480 [Pseudenhygromyxa sp. WMMC2535]|uniref:hypothetical protein n=1 Tax=Pseudenhygromyxa sp. WMMC2535 TaxID=2712867 RepID=UPI001595C4F5|nr:hypothetical protein [Pseudenhygromyxa sp. WMMC2535]NVB40821.1 hypothetical protein [Pseudenhygromyxa sp. WMMC2535]